MPTTVQVSEEVRRALDELKKRWGLKSYDEVIRKMTRERAGGKASFFGAAKGARPFVHDREEEHEFLRD
ncbi:MAG: hypothetical protein JRM74_05165 [Nitrososphaerota archaeon]|nr:hypothetical protein [Nitrososphaerota archaeon]